MAQRTGWAINWSDYNRSPNEDSIWDVATYYIVRFPGDGFGVFNRIIYVGTYLGYGIPAGQVSTFNISGNPIPPARGIKTFYDPTYTHSVSFQSVLPYYRRFFLDILSGFYIGGFVETGGNYDILITQLSRTLRSLRTYTYYFDDTSDEVIYRLYKDGKGAAATGVIESFQVVGIGYTTFKGYSAMGGKNILVLGVDSILNPVLSCIYGGQGTDVGTYLYKIDDTTYMVLGYTDSYIEAGKYGVYVAKINTLNCKPYWIRIYYDTTANLIPYAINKNVVITHPPINGKMTLFHITGTAIEPTSSTYTMFFLTIDSLGDVMNYKRYYVTLSYSNNLWGFENIVLNGDVIVAGGIGAQWLFTDELPRFGASHISPLSEQGGDAILIRLNYLGDTIWARRYGNWVELSGGDLAKFTHSEGFLMWLDKINDSSIVSAGIILDSVATADLDLENFSVRARFLDGDAGPCEDTITVNIFTTPLKVLSDTTFSPVFINRQIFNIASENLSGRAIDCVGRETPFGGARSGPRDFSSRCADIQKYTVYTITGKKVKDGYGKEEISDLPKGVYMIKRGNRVYKVIRR